MREKPRKAAWKPVDYEVADIYALKALGQGKASEGQQKRALDWILKYAAGRLDGNPYRSDADGGERETAFALGRNFVADQIEKLVGMPNELMQRMKDSEH